MSNESNYSFTTKVNGDLFTVRGDTIAEFTANVEQANSVIVALNTLQAAAAQQRSVSSTGRVSTEGDDWGSDYQPKLPAPQAATDSYGNATWDGTLENDYYGNTPTANEAADNTPRCKHGKRVYKEGVGKTGAPYKQYRCPEYKIAEQCEIIWVK